MLDPPWVYRHRYRLSRKARTLSVGRNRAGVAVAGAIGRARDEARWVKRRGTRRAGGANSGTSQGRRGRNARGDVAVA